MVSCHYPRWSSWPGKVHQTTSDVVASSTSKLCDNLTFNLGTLFWGQSRSFTRYIWCKSLQIFCRKCLLGLLFLEGDCEQSRNLEFCTLSQHMKKQTGCREVSEGFPGGAVVKNLPANAGNTGSSRGPGRSHMPQRTKPVRHNYWACPLGPASHNYWALMPQLLKPMGLEPVLRNKRSHRNEKPAHATKSSPCSLQLEKAHAQQRWPNAAKNLKNK